MKPLSLVILLHYNRLLDLTVIFSPVSVLRWSAGYLPAFPAVIGNKPLPCYSSAAYWSRIMHISGLFVPHYTCQRPICPALFLSAAYLSRIITVSGLLVPHYICQPPTCSALYLSAAYLSRIIPVSGLLVPCSLFVLFAICQQPSHLSNCLSLAKFSLFIHANIKFVS